MYPQSALIRLDGLKTELRRRIARQRVTCAEAAAPLARPVEWVDRAWTFCRRNAILASVAAVPLGVVLKRKRLLRLKVIGSCLRWAPVVIGVARKLVARP